MLRHLTKEEFERRTNGGFRTPVFREYLADRETPVSVLTRIADESGDVFLLESVYNGERKGRYSYLGIDPVKAQSPLPFVAAPELPSFQGGRVGYYSYDVISDFEPRVPRRRDGDTPASAFMHIDTFAVFDSVRDTVMIAKIAGPGEYDAAMECIDVLQNRLLSAESIERYAKTHDKRESHLGEFVPEMTKADFCGIVEKCKAAIKAGEVIQIVPSQKFTAKTDISALALYRALRLVNPSPYDFFLRIGSKTMIGSSPEELVRLENGIASIAPIAGTRPRGKTPEEDRDLEAELVALNLGEGGEEVASAEKHLAFVADACAHEEILGDIHKVIVGDDGDMLRAVPLPYFDVFSRLPPNALGEPLAHAVLGGMTHTVHVAEEVGVFHGQSHIIDAILLKVVEVPVYLFVGDFVEG